MARPKTITDEALLDAAREVFLRAGYGAATPVIAKAAGVSEATLFKRFGTKDELFFRALSRCANGSEDLACCEVQPGQGDIAELLERAVHGLIKHFRHEMPRMMLVISHGGFDPVDFFRRNPKAAPRAAFEGLRHLIAAEMTLGRLSQADPGIVVHMMAGSARMFVFNEVVGTQAPCPEASTTYVRGVVDLMLRGIAPPAASQPLPSEPSGTMNP